MLYGTHFLLHTKKKKNPSESVKGAEQIILANS